ncbi:pectinesterase inhibitor 8-like [Phragmites australis]|uniref:pectinesterase inhibitor 8-like n=1 Tax=Phragmites australis TaxID=29695 RepID=UPI002D77EAF6|nr:pectinesterase inhibitor 8-like [Phragmites australis]
MLRPSLALLVVAAALAALSGVDATVVATCMAAANGDRRVNYEFCVSELSKHRDSPDADTWGLAKVAANVGVNNAGAAINDMQALLAKAAPPPPDARTRDGLRRCEKLYYDMELTFAGAYDEINARNYTAGKQKAADAASLVRQCDGGFAEAGLLPPEPLARRGAYTVQIAIICTAITNLIKP